MSKEKVITIIHDKQILIDKSDLDFVYKQKADLEAKLAEKESEIKVGEFWHSAYQGKQLDYDKVYAELRKSYDENEQLKQQLAEKEKEVESYEHELEVYKQNDNVYARNMSRLANRHNQDKISFAVEQLEKVKEEIDNVYKIWRSFNVDLVDIKTGLYSGLQHISSFIDNQIKQLTHQQEDKGE